MNWTFYLDDIEIDEPQGFDSFTINVNRDQKTHGMFFEASTNALGFYGAAANILRAAKNDLGFDADITFRAQSDCGASFTGRLDFGTYRESCGDSCIITMAVEQESCFTLLKSRYNQKVDIDSTTAFDKITQLENYNTLNMAIEIPGLDTEAAVAGSVGTTEINEINVVVEGIDNDIGALQLYVRPTYFDAEKTSIETQYLEPPNAYGENQFNTLLYTGQVVSPVLLMTEKPFCFHEELQVDIRLKGSYEIISSPDDFNLYISLVVKKWNGEQNGSVAARYDIQEEIVLFDQSNNIPSTVSGTFDQTYSFTIPFEAGYGIYPMVFIDAGEGDEAIDSLDVTVIFDPETSVSIVTNRSCPATDARVNMIHETISRVVDSITDKCLSMRSTYYGRTDSEPISYDADGCGSIRALTSGLKIRNAENPKMFISLQDLFEGLKAIDNIGMGIEPGIYESLLVFESVEYFYKNVEILRFDGVPSVTFIHDPAFAYNKVKIGYKRWEVETFNGLDETNSNKEFRTSLNSVQNEIDLTSSFVSGSYAIELTRQQSFADTGAADTTYDNENFILCLERSLNYPYTNMFYVEQGGDDITNVYSPETIMNWRIRPRFNLMRWWKSLISSYANTTNTTSKLFFTSGTANLTSSGKDLAPCNVAALSGQESDDLGKSEVQAAHQTPIWKPTRMEFEYPLSLADYNSLRYSPYGYISVQCGNSADYVRGYILSVSYTPAEGTAKFNLLMQWPTQ